MPPGSPDGKLAPHEVYFVAVAGFTFEFHSLGQTQCAMDYFSQKIRPSSRMPFPAGSMDHWETQRWYDRVPMKLLKEPRRRQVLKALATALAEFLKDRETAG